MNADQFMAAVDGIKDEYIVECAVKSSIRKRRNLRVWSFSVACACFFGVLVYSAVYLFTTEQKHIIWNENADMYEYEHYITQASKGEIVITESLLNAAFMLTPSGPDEPNDESAYLLAVFVMETTGASKDEIYEKFILPLGVKEDYMKSGIIYITKKQLYSIECPDDLAVILSLAVKNNKGVYHEKTIKNVAVRYLVFGFNIGCYYRYSC